MSLIELDLEDDEVWRRDSKTTCSPCCSSSASRVCVAGIAAPERVPEVSAADDRSVCLSLCLCLGRMSSSSSEELCRRTVPLLVGPSAPNVRVTLAPGLFSWVARSDVAGRSRGRVTTMGETTAGERDEEGEDVLRTEGQVALLQSWQMAGGKEAVGEYGFNIQTGNLGGVVEAQEVGEDGE
ncbi:hypothetical protein BCR39DRAFT_546897 [Naematelia encephala]|uniref:Uncharacterized protein n=1 Tax=Naematelia encephala TaxID=71784 RepID=A0A1Y2AQZ3_9TREE|nr:hypothetical protein BCR39DRAFT_546897 [Naematelia encephala]